VQVIGHSQGPLEVRWAIRWWPDIRFLIDDLIGIAAPYHGWRETDLYCSSPCIPALWQMRMESRFMRAANVGDETPGPVSYSSVYTTTDELVQPYQTADLRGGSNIAVQDICPGRSGRAHPDGLRRRRLRHRHGRSHPSRPGRSNPHRPRDLPAEHHARVDASDLAAGEADFWSKAPTRLSEHQVASEPPLAAYAAG
jgi:triacylglycerol lipase